VVFLGAQFLAPFAIRPLDILQSFLFDLSAGEVVLLAIVQILSILRIRVERIRIHVCLEGEVFVEGVHHFIVPADLVTPSPR